MKKQMICMAAAAGVFFGGANAVAAQDIGAIYTNCGLGGAIFPNGDQDVAPVIVNILVSSPTVLTQGLLLPDSCSGAGGVSARMMHVAYPHFEADVAVGEGEYIDALMDVMSCSPSVRADLVADMRSNLTDNMTDVTYVSMEDADKARDMYVHMHETIQANYAGQCDAIN